MPSLAACLAKLGKKLSDTDKDSLKTRSKELQKEGFERHEADVQAVQEAIDELQVERKDIVAQLREKVAWQAKNQIETSTDAGTVTPTETNQQLEGEPHGLQTKAKAEEFIETPTTQVQKTVKPTPGAQRAFLPDGSSIETRYVLRDASALVVSHDHTGKINPAYPKELQPRDRERAASKLQIQTMAAKLNPELLGASAKVSDGAPIIGPDNVVESGNARSVATRFAYRNGQAKTYKQWLRRNAEQFGFTTEQVDALKNPVLVRERITDVDRAEFARKANQADLASMSPAETAKADAERITGEMMAQFNPSEDGNVLAESNRSFVKSFLGIIGQQESTQYIGKEGGYSKRLADRVQAAVFAKAYGDERLLAAMAEEADPGIKNVLTALNRAAASFAQAKALGIGKQLDVTPSIVEAVELIRKAKNSGVPVAELLSQQTMFHRTSDEAKLLATYMADNMRSAKNMGEALSYIGNTLVSEMRRAQNKELFNRQPATIRGIIEASIKRMEATHGEPAGQQQTIGAETNQPATEKPYHPQKGEKAFGPNEEGYPVGEDAKGNRFFVRDGVRVSAPAEVVPTRRGVWAKVRTPEELYRSDRHEFLTQSEVAEFKAQEQPAETEPQVTPAQQIADWVKRQIADGKVFAAKDLFQQSAKAYGTVLAEGKYSVKDAYDAMELGINQYIAEHPAQFNPQADDLSRAKQIAHKLQNIITKIATQAKRTAEMDEFQQFSTPPPLAYAVAWTANLGQHDVVLEPSAGVGGLAVFARNSGVQVIVNELSKRRLELLRAMGFDRVFNENAEQLNNILPDDVKPTVVIMNPPFSSTAGRITGKRDTKNAMTHIEQALNRLASGGRLVAIVGRGMALDSATFKSIWSALGKRYAIRADIGVSGKEYAKYGTTFDNRIIVIDKVNPQGYTTIEAEVNNAVEAITALQEVRNDRPSLTQEATTTKPSKPVERERTEPAMPVRTETGEGAGGREGASQPTADVVGVREREADQQELGSPGLRGESANMAPGGREHVADHGGGRGTGGRAENRPIDTGGTGGGPDRTRLHPVGGYGEVRSVESEEQEIIGTDLQQARADESIYDRYRPTVTVEGAKQHPGSLVESAAMASVKAPNTSYRPSIPKSITSTGKLSDAQLETIIRAGSAHAESLDDGRRRGFFIGDGTGVGKGREIAGIILDNWNQGRKKAVWLSASSSLFKDAQRDVKGIGDDPDKVFNLGKIKAGSEVKSNEGILFGTYGLLKHPSGTKQNRIYPRLDQIVQWVGDDFDGVIVFDESHKMGNAIPVRTGRGKTNPSTTALVGIILQNKLPKARVVYVSATGATEVMNLGYATRLGLWGEGTPFPDVTSFINEIDSGGIAAMELVARDLKALGMYTARSLSYHDVTYERIEHALNDDQKDIYDKLAEAWQVVLSNVNAALELTNSKRGAAMSAFWGSHQRFFNQVVTALQMPTILQRMQSDLDNDKSSVVLQIVNTNEASLDRKLAEMSEEETLDDLDLTPRDQLMQYVERSFPVQQFEEFEDENGNIDVRPVLDSNGKPVLNAESVAMRERLLDEIGSIRVPDGPLDMVLKEYGSKNIAEVTGRTQRVVTDENGKRVKESRSKPKTEVEAAEFMGGKRRILIFSNAGGTGLSYHADLNAKNQQPRVHYLVQPGWQANAAVQGFGRTHRTNQAQAPHYVLVTTDLKGQKRFISSIARRLDQLGALTKGQRQTGGQGFFEARDNLEGQHAHDALNQFFNRLFRDGEINGISLDDFEQQTGLNLSNKDKNLRRELPTMQQFLNRLLSLKYDAQNKVFDAFSEDMDRIIEREIRNGTLDRGIENLKANKIDLVNEQTVHTDKRTGAETKYIEIDVTNPAPTVSWDGSGRYAKGGYYQNRTSGRVWAASTVRNRTTRQGDIVSDHAMVGPNGAHQIITAEDLENSEKWTRLSVDGAREVWEKGYAEAPKTITERKHLITGVILPIWDRLHGTPRVLRVITQDGRKFLGRLVSPTELQSTLANLGAHGNTKQYTNEEAVSLLARSYTLSLANQWQIRPARVSDEWRYEIVGPDYRHMNELEKVGVFSERINWRTRYFLPTGPEAVAAMEQVTKNRPIVDAVAPVGRSSQEPAFSFRDNPGTGMSRDELDAHIAPIASAWTNGPQGGIRVVQSAADLPAIIREKAKGGIIEGVYDPATQSVYLVADNIASTDRAEQLIAHEVFAHHGLEAFLGTNGARKFYQEVIGLYGKKGFQEIADARGFDLNTVEGRLSAAKEKLAQMAETGEKPGLLRRIYAAMREALKRLGFHLKLTDGDIQAMLARAQSYVEGGATNPALGVLGAVNEFAQDVSMSLKTAAQKIVDAPAFKRWFGKSEVVDENGEPLVVYHGTRKEFRAFDNSLLGAASGHPASQLGFFFTEGTSVANQFATGEAGRVIPAYISMDNPLEISADDFQEMLFGDNEDWRDAWDDPSVIESFSELKQEALTNGHDGIHILQAESAMESFENEWPQWIVFQPTQIKSIFNRGTFDENNPDILFSIAHPIDTLLDFAQSKLEAEPKNSAIKVMFGGTNDIRSTEALFKLPAWLAKTSKVAKDFFDRQTLREKTRSKMTHDYIQSAVSAYELSDADKEQFSKLVYDLDGKAIFDGRIYQSIGKRMVQKRNEIVEIPIMAVNPKYYEALEKHLDELKMSPTIKTAYMDARRTLDQMWIAAHDKLADLKDIDADLVKKFRTEMGSIPQYWPHNRYGNWYVQVIDPKAPAGEQVLYREHFTSPNRRWSEVWLSKNLDRIVKENPGLEAEGLEWKHDAVKQMPETVFEFPLNVDAMQQIINAATDQMPTESGVKEKLRRVLSEEVSNQLKSRGYGSHFIKRKGVPGYDMSDALRVLHDQIQGFSGWLTKVEAAHDFSNMLTKLDAKNQPNEYAWATQYVHDMLENQTKTDRFVDAAKSVMFMNWLGGNIKNLAVNLTQNIILGTPTLGRHVGLGRANAQWLKAIKDLRIAVTDKGVIENPRLTEQERGFLADMIAEGWGRGQLMDELRGRMSGPAGKFWNKATQVMGWPMQASEQFNRLTLGLAAFRAAMAGQIYNEGTLTSLEMTAGQKFSYDTAKRFAEYVVNDAHFQYSKGNKPQFARGSLGGKALSAAYTFRTFSHNLLSAWRYMLGSGDKDAMKAFAASIMGTIALGGLGAIPIYQTLAALIRQLFGEDPLESGLRKKIPAPMRDLVMYGAPSALGINIGGSLGMELPVLDRARINKDFKDQLGETLGNILGPPYALVSQYMDAIDAMRSGNTARAVESASPAFIKNILSAHRLATEGQTTVSGKPIAVPGEKEARKLTAGEAIAKGLGFQPLSSTKAFEMHRTLSEVKSYRDEKQEEWANKYVQAKRAGDLQTATAIKEEARQWNREAVLKGRPDLKVDLHAAIAARRKPAQPMRQMKGMAKELREAYGM